ncbi:MAG: pilus assembly protein [Planctomycetales bacterium]|nr:pilus assembly protein [Planctomycetales bacterium]
MSFHCKLRRTQRSKRHGTTLVEFAFVFPIIILFFLFTFEIGRVLMLQHTADTAAYEAARSAMVPGATANDAITIATELVQSADLKQVNVEVIPADITEDTGLITVRVDVPIAGNSWVTPQIFFPNATVSSEVTLMCERSPLIRLTALPALKAKKTQMNNNSGL